MKTIKYTEATTTNELNQILELQKRNLPSALSDSECQTQGFVTVQHSYELLEKMNKVQPHILAKAGDKVVGYALSMHPKFKDNIEVLNPMFKEIRSISNLNISENLSNYIVMGQICIDKEYRKQGIFRNLYGTMKELIKPNFDCIITEVDAINTRSLNAHYAVGFRDLKTYFSNGQEWKLIILA